VEKRYLQLWLNQLATIHDFLQHSVVRPELHGELWRNLVDCLSMKNMQKHCSNMVRSTQILSAGVNEILKKIEPPATAAQVKPDRIQDAST